MVKLNVLDLNLLSGEFLTSMSSRKIISSSIFCDTKNRQFEDVLWFDSGEMWALSTPPFLSAHLTTLIFFIHLCLLLLSVFLICTVCMYKNYIKALLVTFLRSLSFFKTSSKSPAHFLLLSSGIAFSFRFEVYTLYLCWNNAAASETYTK